jgi:hypothetical protein
VAHRFLLASLRFIQLGHSSLIDAFDEKARDNENRSEAGEQRNMPAKRARPGRFYPLRGRCVCDLCNQRMQGSTQKSESYMRCLWASGRGKEAAKATGHPGSLQVSSQSSRPRTCRIPRSLRSLHLSQRGRLSRLRERQPVRKETRR